MAAGGGGDPAILCSELPAITVGRTINGELTTSDAMDSGRYFDLYGFPPDEGAAPRLVRLPRRRCGRANHGSANTIYGPL